MPAPPAHGPDDLLTAREAARLLGVQVRTLYAYVSRGLVPSVPGPGRARRYRRVDVERLRGGRGAGPPPGEEAAGALRWGAPVLDSSITEIQADGPHYRGAAAVELARAGRSFEAVAELLWTGRLPEEPPVWALPGGRAALGLSAARLEALVPEGSPPLGVLALLVPALALADPGRFDRSPGAVLPRARRLVRRMAAATALAAGGGRARLQRALGRPRVAASLAAAVGARGGSAAVAALDRALVLWADHELNASSFAARVAASAEADVYSCVSAGLATLAGPRHGAACDRIEALLQDAGRPEEVERVLHERARRGVPLPGFEQPLYPHGDPRAVPLLEAARALAPDDRRVTTAFALIDAVGRESGRRPTVDTGMVALAAALGLRPGLASAVAAVGRCVGWTAHVLEQYAAGYLIRPRARFRRGEA